MYIMWEIGCQFIVTILPNVAFIVSDRSSPKHGDGKSGSRRSSKTLDVPNQRRSFSIIEHTIPDEPTVNLNIAVPNVVAPWEDEA